MGHRVEGKCLECGADFHIDHDGGFAFHLLRCDRCGKTKEIGFEKLGELHIRYLKGFTVPYSIATAEADERARKLPSGPPISEDEYHAGVEAYAGRCRCRGKYRFDSPPRCPKCRSTRIAEGRLLIMYD